MLPAGLETEDTPARPLDAAQPRDRALWLPITWATAALLFASLRTPFDDEWYSLGLAGQRDAARFWAALAADIHPPWVALLDRAVLAGAGARWLVNLTRVLASAGAMWIAANLVRRQLGFARVYVWLAALHPIVFMYAGTARWYPFLFLAHALRALSIWGARPGRARSGALFVTGSALGMAASYVEPPFVLLDLVWLHLRSAGQPHARRNLGWIALLSLAALVGLRLASPIGAAHASLGYGQFHLVLSQMVTWLVLGIAGEAALPFPFPLLGLAVAAAAVLGFATVVRNKDSRPYALFIASNAVVWLCVAPFGIWHPRYSLEVWLALTLMVGVALTCRSRWRVLAWLASAQLLIALTLTLLGRGFYKADLNRLDSASCSVVHDAGAQDLIVAPYPGLAESIARTCAPPAPITAVDSIRIVPDADAQLAPLRQRLRAAARVFLLTVNVTSSLTETENRVRDLLSRLCVRIGSMPFGATPHYTLKHLWKPDAKPYRFQRETWQCPAFAGPMGEALDR